VRDHFEAPWFDRLHRAARGWLNITVRRELFLSRDNQTRKLVSSTTVTRKIFRGEVNEICGATITP
jgi:hypothetical protein